jgi:hypothetical protein
MLGIWQYMLINSIKKMYRKATELTEFADIPQVIKFVNEYMGIKIVQGHYYNLCA